VAFFVPSLSAPNRFFPARAWSLALIALTLALAPTRLPAARPYDLPAFNPAAPNYARVFSNVRLSDTTVTADAFRIGDEILASVLAYLAPTSGATVFNQPAYRDRLFVLMDEVARRWNAASPADLDEIGYAWQMNYAYLLMRHHRPAELSAERIAAYEAAIARSNTYILTVSNPLLYEQRVLANLWLNGDIRLAMAVYFGGTALATPTGLADAEKARRAIDEVMSMASLEDGGQRYVGFWGEVSTYHEENVYCFAFWWLITGSVPIKAALDATVTYTPVAVEPNGFTEQSSNIPYKHMYNNLINRHACLWKAYLYDDGYNYYFGQPAETANSTELLTAILYQPNRRRLVPPAHVGVFFDGNIQGPRGRFDGRWGWVAHGRNVQDGGPESQPLITAQALDGRQCGKDTLVGAFAMDDTPPLVGNTALKGALTGLTLEVKTSAGAETDLFRGNRYRYLTQDERTATITRPGFGTLSSRYRLSTRTSANASATWGNGLPWIGQQLWVLTGERLIGLVQLVADAESTVHGLDVRLVFTGGRRGIMGSFLPLTQPDATSFAFGDLRARIHDGTFLGATTTERMAISDPASTDDYSALVRIHDAAVANDTAFTVPAGTRRWMVIEITRPGAAMATSPKFNVLPENATFAVLQFVEGTRAVRIVQNLTASEENYSGTFHGVTGYTRTTLHRSWSNTITALPLTGATATVATTLPAWSHAIAVNSNNAGDHTNGAITTNALFGTYDDLFAYSLGAASRASDLSARYSVAVAGDRLRLSFLRARADVTYHVEASSDLATWTSLATNPGLPGESVTVDDPTALANGSRFLRLRVTKP
jgi:hypothetical protein